MNITHVGIVVKDLEASVKFYTEVLGLAEARRVTSRGGLTLVFLKGEGGAMIELLGDPDGSGWETASEQEPIRHVVFEVRDMDASAKALQDKGIRFTSGPIVGHGGTIIAFYEDPNGVTLELAQQGTH